MSEKLSKKEIIKLKDKLKQKDIPFVYVPSSLIKEMVLKGDLHPTIFKLPKEYKLAFLQDRGLRIESQLLIQWLEGTIDEHHKFMFDNGFITIEGEGNFKIGKQS